MSSLGQTKDYNICICCFSSNIAALRSKRKYWLARNKNNVFELIDMSIRGLLLQWASTVKCNSSCCSRTKRISSSSFHWNGTCSRYDIAPQKKCSFSVKQQLLTHSCKYINEVLNKIEENNTTRLLHVLINVNNSCLWHEIDVYHRGLTDCEIVDLCTLCIYIL